MSESNSTASGVYMIRCATGKVYVGSAVDIAQRWRIHRWSLANSKHHSRHLQRAWDKYGPDAFEWSVLETVPIDGLTTEEAKQLLLDREQHHIDVNNAVRRGFNLCPKASSQLGVKYSDESRAKIKAAQNNRSPEHQAKVSEICLRNAAANPGRKNSPEHIAKTVAAHQGRKRSEQTKANISAGLRGKPLSEEHRAKVSAFQRGRQHSPEHVAKVAEANRGRQYSPETRAKLSAAAQGRKMAPETVAKMAAMHRGKKLSEEHRAKLSEASRGRKHTPETRAKLAAIAQQRLQDPQWRAQLVTLSHNRQPASDETRAKIAAASRAQKHSPER